jgi:hypothetical protein
MQIRLFEFDIASTLLVLVVVLGVFFLSNAMGSALSRISATIFSAIIIVAGILLWVLLYYFSGMLSGINFFDYFLYLYTLLEPFGLLIYDSATLTLASTLVFIIELGLISGYADTRIRRRRRGLQLERSQALNF